MFFVSNIEIGISTGQKFGKNKSRSSNSIFTKAKPSKPTIKVWMDGVMLSDDS